MLRSLRTIWSRNCGVQEVLRADCASCSIGTPTAEVGGPRCLSNSSLVVSSDTERQVAYYRAVKHKGSPQSLQRAPPKREAIFRQEPQPKKQHASSRHPRLLGGNPLTKVRLEERKKAGIEEDRGYEQDNTWKKMRKEKPPRGHPDRKPRHANNPRRIPDLFRVTRHQKLLKLVEFHHDYISWQNLHAFVHRAAALYRLSKPQQQLHFRTSGLLELLRDRAEELDLREAEPQAIEFLQRSFKAMDWDPGPATTERMNARLALIENTKSDAIRQGHKVMKARMLAARRFIRQSSNSKAW